MKRTSSKIYEVRYQPQGGVYTPELNITWQNTYHYTDRDGKEEALTSNQLLSVQLPITDEEFMDSFIAEINRQREKARRGEE